jgi:hypothetical protein
MNEADTRDEKSEAMSKNRKNPSGIKGRRSKGGKELWKR